MTLFRVILCVLAGLVLGYLAIVTAAIYPGDAFGFAWLVTVLPAWFVAFMVWGTVALVTRRYGKRQLRVPAEPEDRRR